jgi:hypothetical protein
VLSVRYRFAARSTDRVRSVGSALAIALALSIAGCSAGGSATHATSTTPASPTRAVVTTPGFTAGANTQRYGGWDANGKASTVFRIAWNASPSGRLTGVMHLAFPHRHHTRRVRTAVTGTETRVYARENFERIRLHLAKYVFASNRFHGRLYRDNHLDLTLVSDSDELNIYGSSVAVGSRYRRHIAALRGPGGYQGWLRRRDERHPVIRHFDVNGDGRPDRIVTSYTHLADPFVGSGTVKVTVRYAGGGKASTTVRVHNGIQRPLGARVGWIGQVHLPGLAGKQAVILTDVGAANRFYTVVGDVGGTLRHVPAPEPDDQWGDGGSAGTGTIGRYCSGDSLVTFSKFEHYRRNDPKPVSTRLFLNRSRWSGTGWVQLEHLNATMPPAQARKARPPRGHGLWGCG